MSTQTDPSTEVADRLKRVGQAEGGQPKQPQDEQPTRISNEVPSKVVVYGDGGRTFVLSPLERRSLTKDDWQSFGADFRTLEERRVVALDIERGSKPEVDAVWILVGLAIWIVPAYLVAGIFFGSFLYWLAGLLAVALLVIVWVAVKKGKESSLSLQKLSWPLLVVLAIGIAAPVSAVYFGGDVNTAVDVLREQGGDELVYLTLIGRTLQAVLIAIASLLPALLYFLFDRLKVETLRGSFVRDIFRFDPAVVTLSDVRARYGPLMDELYGPDEARALPSTPGQKVKSGTRSQPGRRAPVWVATVVITLGWILCLLNPDVDAPLTSANNIVSLFEPQRSPVVFGFLGAYVFALQYLLRSYLRADLRPKSYTHVTVRIFVAVIFAWVLELLFLADPAPTSSEDSLLVIAFVVGILPETLLVRLQETVRQVVGGTDRQRLPALYERYPLTELEGIDIYDRARLLEEGVGNIEGLAHHDLPELMMQTRIPVGRLVYWTDQAILFLHVAATVDGSQEKRGAYWQLRILQEHGIHTATDLKNAHDAAEERGVEKLDAFLSLLGPEEPERGNRPYRLQVILDAMKDEEWMRNLEYWHEKRRDCPKTLVLKNGRLLEGADPAGASAPGSISPP